MSRDCQGGQECHLRLAHGRDEMSWDENAEDCYVDESHNQSSSPFHVLDCFSVLGDDRNPVDDDLHQELDFEYPEEEDEEEGWDAIMLLGLSQQQHITGRWTYSGFRIPSSMSQTMIVMATLETISPHTM